MLQELDSLRDRALTGLSAITTASGLEDWRIQFLGRKGELATLLGGMGTLPADQRPAAGARANAVKQELEAAFAAAQAGLAASREFPVLDVSLPGRRPAAGGLHVITQVTREITGIFQDMGFQVVEGPEVEWDFYNFEALNMPRDHPARDAHDTFWVTDPDGERPLLMRTHTSPVQIRTMEEYRPPLRIVAPGRVYRYEATDATHESQFSQVEGFAVDTGITFADLKGTLHEFARRLFGRERRIRFRCDYFPYVEPGVDMAIDFFAGKRGDEDDTAGWIEILGAGMIHPDVLRRVSIDPDVYSGFAFGVGPERVAILKYGIEDIRNFYANDLQFLEQFR